MSFDKEHARLGSLVAGLKEVEALQVVVWLIDNGEVPIKILKSCEEGIRRVGEHYEKGIYFISGLIMAGEIMNQVAALLQPLFKERIKGESTGRVLIGTVQGDIHNIGKDFLKTFLEAEGFEVKDLGVDVSPIEFVRQLTEYRPAVICLSALINIVYDSMRDTITLLREKMADEKISVPIIIGGGAVNEDVWKFVGADYWAIDAHTGIRIVQQIVS